MEHQEAVNTLASERYILGEMTDAERDSFEEHFFSCADCADDVMAAETMRAGARGGLIEAPKTDEEDRGRARGVISSRAPGVSSWFAWRPAIVVPWAAAASLALLAGYESSRAASVPHEMTSPLAISPVTLRAATRGQELTVAAKTGGVVALAIDLGGSQFDDGLKYEITGEGGSVVGAGVAAAPAPGAPLLLVIPSSLFKTSGRYVLTLRSSGGPDSARSEYRFAVKLG
jgi:hypothetical protein